jgi:hypothetical protein
MFDSKLEGLQQYPEEQSPQLIAAFDDIRSSMTGT